MTTHRCETFAAAILLYMLHVLHPGDVRKGGNASDAPTSGDGSRCYASFSACQLSLRLDSRCQSGVRGSLFGSWSKCSHTCTVPGLPRLQHISTSPRALRREQQLDRGKFAN